MKKIMILVLITLSFVHANTSKGCIVLGEPDATFFDIRPIDSNKSIIACTKAIKDNQNKIQYWYDLGRAYVSNNNSKKALLWYSKAASKGHADAQYSLGNIYNYKKPYIDNKKAINWYLKAAANHHVSSQIELGDMYEEGKGVKKDIKTALSWYKKAADLNDSYAEKHLGDMYYDGKDVQQNYEKAMNWYLKAAESTNSWDKDGDTQAQTKIADMYYDGIGVKKDYKKAFKWFMRSAKQGNSYAQYRVGYMYTGGEWVTKNYKKAFKWLMKSAEQRYTDAQYAIAKMYELGIGTKVDNTKYFYWLQKAAEQDHLVAQRFLAITYHEGKGVRKNYNESFKWFMKAAMEGDVASQGNTGLLYAKGEGTKKNYIKSYAWYSIALSQKMPQDSDYDEVNNQFKIVSLLMTPEQIAIAQNYDPLKKNEEVEDKPDTKKAESAQVYTGTGFFVDKSTVLTNHHVVRNCNRIELIRKGYKSTAKVKAKDSINDLAILEADKVNNSSLNFRAGKGIRIGDDIIVIGYPLGELLGSGIKLTTGNVSALTGLINDTTSMQLTAPVQPGNSGGPLFDKSANVVGIVIARLKKEQNVNLAIKANVAQMFLDINNIDYGVSMSKDKKDVADIADEAKDSIVQIVCYQ